MGFLSGIGSFLGKAAGFIGGSALGMPWLGTALGAGLDFLGSERQNAASAQMAMNQMKFQREMSNTSYQRGVMDMRAAGLNPALAYAQGGASTPAGALGQVPNNTLGRGVSTAIQAAQAAASVKNVMEDTELKKAQAAQAIAVARNNNVNSALTATQQPKADIKESWYGSWRKMLLGPDSGIPNNARSNSNSHHHNPLRFR